MEEEFEPRGGGGLLRYTRLKPARPADKDEEEKGKEFETAVQPEILMDFLKD